MMIFYSPKPGKMRFFLSLVCINRYLDNEIKDDFFERVYGLYKTGGWVCGMKKEQFLLFDPRSI